MINRYPKNIKQECLKLFLEGKTLSEIAEVKNVPFETIKKWHLRNNWAKENKKTVLKVSEKIQSIVSKEKAQEQLDVRQELINKINEAKELMDALIGKNKEHLEKVKTNPMQWILLFNALQRYLFCVAKIDGLIIDKNKSDADINIAYEITRILSYRQQGIYSDNPYLRALPMDKKNKA